MYFAFLNRGSDGKLIVSQSKIEPKEIEVAKKQSGGGTLVEATIFGKLNELFFKVAKPQPATLEATLKKVAKRDAGLAIVPIIQVAG
jgi:hypothetical protein